MSPTTGTTSWSQHLACLLSYHIVIHAPIPSRFPQLAVQGSIYPSVVTRTANTRGAASVVVWWWKMKLIFHESSPHHACRNQRSAFVLGSIAVGWRRHNGYWFLLSLWLTDTARGDAQVLNQWLGCTRGRKVNLITIIKHLTDLCGCPHWRISTLIYINDEIEMTVGSLSSIDNQSSQWVWIATNWRLIWLINLISLKLSSTSR